MLGLWALGLFSPLQIIILVLQFKGNSLKHENKSFLKKSPASQERQNSVLKAHFCAP